MSLKIAAVVGARPNLMKIAPLMHEFVRHAELDAVLIHSGQHYDERMSDLFFRELGIPAPDHYLGVGSGTQAVQTANVMTRLEPVFEELSPDLVLVVGDVNSTLAAALVAAKLGIPIAHVEAGLRSFDRGMPEEINRVVTDALSDLLFTTEPVAAENLRREGVPAERIHFVGNVMIDTLEQHRAAAAALDVAGGIGLEPRRFLLITLHRPALVDSPALMGRLLDALAELGEYELLFPIHPRTRRRLDEAGLLQRALGIPRLRLVEPLGYLEFLGLMMDAAGVLTDSGGVQEETTALGVPCLTLRENTERPVTISEGTNRLIGLRPERIPEEVRALPARQAAARAPELWDGRAAERIAAVLRELHVAGRLGAGERTGGRPGRILQ